VVAGQAAIAQSGSQMTVTQSTDKAILNWQSFNIGSQAGVTFQQPSASAVALNRVLGSDPSAIYGALNANGQVFLVNPNGVLFGQGARVDVGGLVASTLNIRNEDFLAGNHRFTRDGATAGVTNQGELLGKYVALLAPEVRNEGVIATTMGTAALAAGEAVTLGITGNALIDVQVEQASIDTLVENKHLIQADAGTVVLSAQSAHTLLGQVVNSGAIEAQGLVNEGGTVRLLASSSIDHSGSITADAGANGNGGTAILLADLANPNSQTSVSGSITARGGSASGDGGFVETSGTHLKITDTARIDTSAAQGKAGTWLLDPDDFTIGTDITGATLGTLLNSNNVTIQTTGTTSTCATDAPASCGSGATGTGNGDIFVNDAVSWGSVFALTLDAWRNIEVSQAISVTGSGGLTLKYGQQAVGSGNTASYLLSAPINLASGATFQTYLGNDDVTGTSYTIVNDRATLDTVASGSNYVLGADFAAGATAFTPISSFTNVFDGLGHTIDGLTIDTAVGNNSGLFAEVGGFMMSGGEVRNLGLTNVNVTGTASWLGGIAGTNWGSIHHSYVTGNVGSAGGAGTLQTLAGLVGSNNGSIASSYSGATVTGASGDLDAVVGGLVGLNTATSGSGGSIDNSYATGAVSKASGATTGAIGGLVGSNEADGSISNSYSSGSVSASGSSNQGGLVGMNGNNDVGTGSTITNSYYNSTTSGQGAGIGNDVAATPQTVTAKTTAELTAATVLADLGLSNVIWLRDSATGYPVLRGIVYSASGAPTVVYIRLIPGSSTYGDAVNLTYGLFDAATAGNSISDASPSGTVSWTGTLPTSTSNVGIYSLTYSGSITLGNAGYSLAAGDAASWTINPRTVTLSASKTYDGTTALTGTQVTIGNTVGIQTLTYNGATVSDAHVATLSKYISAITLADGLNGGLASNYQLPTLNNANAPVTINAKALSVTAPTISAVSKTYDGLLAATGSSVTGGSVTGFFGSDTGSLNTSAITLAYNSAHVAAATTIAATGATTLNFTGTATGSGNGTTGNEVAGQATDYSFSAPTISSVAGTISAKQLTATASITAAAKTYDGLLAATGSTVSGGLSGELNGDSITLDTSGLSLAFNDAHVATASKTISASGNVALGTLTAGGSGSKDGTAGNAVAGALGDYVLAAQPTISSVAGTITPKTLTASLSNTGVTKVYDATTNAPAGFTPAYTLSGFATGDTAASLSHTGAAYNSKDVLSANTVTVSGLSITGVTGTINSVASDYAVPASLGVTASITAKALDLLSLTVAQAEVGATTATLSGTAALKTAIAAGTGTASDGTPYSGDAVQPGGTAVGTIPVPAQTAGTSVTVNVSGLILSGTEASNYTLKTPQATLTGTSVSAPIQASSLPFTIDPIYQTVAEALAAVKKGAGDRWHYSADYVKSAEKQRNDYLAGQKDLSTSAMHYAKLAIQAACPRCSFTNAAYEAWLGTPQQTAQGGGQNTGGGGQQKPVPNVVVPKVEPIKATLSGSVTYEDAVGSGPQTGGQQSGNGRQANFDGMDELLAKYKKASLAVVTMSYGEYGGDREAASKDLNSLGAELDSRKKNILVSVFGANEPSKVPESERGDFIKVLMFISDGKFKEAQDVIGSMKPRASSTEASTTVGGGSAGNGSGTTRAGGRSRIEVHPTAWTQLELKGADKDLASKIAAQITANPANAAALVKALVAANPEHAEAIKASAKVTLPSLEIEAPPAQATKVPRLNVSAATNLPAGTEVTVSFKDASGKTKTTTAKVGEDGSVKADGVFADLKLPVTANITSANPKFESENITLGGTPP
jgi:filamentous hemagglutinin family protein